MSRSISARSIKSSGLAGLALLLTTLTAPGARADTEVGGYILEDTTWDAAGSPYVVISSIIIGGDATLTIEPGVEVRFRQGLGLAVGDEVEGAGTLVARGTDLSPIVFTSNDPYEDPPGPAEPGDWVSIRFTDYAVDAVYDNGEYQTGSILEYVVVEYAGGGQAAVKVRDSSPYLARCEIRHNADSGIRVWAPNAPSIRIEECEIWGNTASQGAGLYVHCCYSPMLSGNSISGNTASGPIGNGGGLYLSACLDVTLSGNTISGNTAEDGGGGLFIEDCYAATLSGNTICGNTADYAGGLYLQDFDAPTVSGNTITGNTAYGGGGGLSVVGSDAPALSGNIISGNMAENDGGGLDLFGCNAPTVSGNMISANTAYDGAGLHVGLCYAATLSGNTITENTADEYGDGGGLYIEDCNIPTVSGNTVTDNTAGEHGDGGGLYLQSCDAVTLSGNTISGNMAAGPVGRGGGLCLGGSEAATLSGNTISGNAASRYYGQGGAVYLCGCDAVTVSMNTITENTADDEGGAMCLCGAYDATLSSNRITNNQTLAGQTGGIYVTDDTERLSLAGDPNAFEYNMIAGNDGYQLYNNNPFDGSGANDIDARWVVWCTDDPNAIEDGIYHYPDDANKALVYWYPFFEHIPGDLDGDWSVDLSDLAILLSNYPMPSGAVYEDGDLDGDGDVDLADLAALLANYRTSCD